MKNNQNSSVSDQLDDFLKKNRYTGCMLLSGHTIYSLYGNNIAKCLDKAGIPYFTHCVEMGEKAKTLANAENCWKAMHTHGLDRSSLVIGLGGGTITDLVGFVASCYMRGIDSLYIPTTLLGMVDASIGGKTGVNLPTGKNIIGTFHAPKAIFNSLEYLKTLPKRELRSGLAEVIKCAVIRDQSLFEYLENEMASILSLQHSPLHHIIHKAKTIKTDIVSLDAKEKGMRAHLNYGHTFAHAIETATNYETYSHGEAVSIGMMCAAYVSHILGFVDEKFVIKQKELCRLAGLPTTLPKSIDSKKLIALMRLDKKNSSGEINLILPKKIGEVAIVPNVDTKIIHTAIEKVGSYE